MGLLAYKMMREIEMSNVSDQKEVEKQPDPWKIAKLEEEMCELARKMGVFIDTRDMNPEDFELAITEFEKMLKEQQKKNLFSSVLNRYVVATQTLSSSAKNNAKKVADKAQNNLQKLYDMVQFTTDVDDYTIDPVSSSIKVY